MAKSNEVFSTTGGVTGSWWRRPVELRRLRAIARANPSMEVNDAFADGEWFYCIDASSRDMVNWALEAAGFPERHEQPLDENFAVDPHAADPGKPTPRDTGSSLSSERSPLRGEARPPAPEIP